MNASRPPRGARSKIEEGRPRARGAAQRAGKPSNGRRSPAAVNSTPRAAIRLEQVQDALGEILQWAQPADMALSRWLRARPKLGARDRNEVAEAVYDVLRHLRRYRHFAESGSGPANRRLAIQGLANLLPADTLAQALNDHERAWLQHIGDIDVNNLPTEIRYSIPDWLMSRLAGIEDADSLLASLNQAAPLDIRVNPFKADREAVLNALENSPAAQAQPRPTPFSPWGIRLQGRPPINRWPMFEKGEIEVQDEGSQILVSLMAPKRGEMIIDYCAGAGGKTLLLGALMRSTGRLYAFDVSAARLARAKPRFARSGLSNIVPVVIKEDVDPRVKRLRDKAHRVLVDAPCTGLGTLRRNPDLKWRQHPEALVELQRQQAQILQRAAACVAPGGRLVYATCSVLREENEAQVEAFLANNPDFSLLDAPKIAQERCKNLTLPGPYLNLRPDRHGTDGFFAAVLERNRETKDQ